MLLVALLIVLLMTLAGYYVTRDLFSPFVIQPGVWTAVLLFYFVAQPDYYPICHDLPGAIVLWSLGFAIAAYSVYYLVPKRHGLLNPNSLFLSGGRAPSPWVTKAYFISALLAIPFMLYTLVYKALVRGETNILLYLRVSGVDETLERPDFGLGTYLIPVPLVLLVYSMLYPTSKRYKTLIVLLNILVGILTMSKTSFFVFLIAILYLRYTQKKLKARTLVFWAVAFIVFSGGFQYVRSIGLDDNATFSVTSLLELYTLSPLVAFDYYAPTFSSAHWGENVFRLYYAIMHSLGSDVQPVENILTFVGVPDLTNTYTILYPFYVDFGLPGVAIFGGVYGAFFGYLYKRASEKNLYYQAIYACFLNYLVLQFVQENIFSNLSLNIQYVLYIMLPYLLASTSSAKKKMPEP